MACLRSAYFLRNIIGNSRQSFQFFTRHANQDTSFFCPNMRYYSITTKQQTLQGILRDMKSKTQKGQFITRKDVTELMNAFQIEQPTSNQYFNSLMFFGEILSEETPEHRLKMVQKLWESLENGYVVDIRHYNALLNVYIENEKWFSMEEILYDMKLKKLKPNTTTYERILINYCCQGNLYEIQRVLTHMLAEGMKLNGRIYNTLILAHGLAGKQEIALKILETMQRAGFQPTWSTYFALLRGHARSGDIDTMLSEITRLKSMQINIQDKDILQLIYDLTVNGHGASCEPLFRLLIRKSYYSHYAMNIVNRLILKKHDEMAFKLLKTFPTRSTDSGTNRNSGGFLLNYMIKANRSLADIVDMCRRLSKEGLHSTPFQVILPTIKEYRSPDELWTVLREHKANGIPVAAHSFRSIIESASETEALESLRFMVQDFNIQPTIQFLLNVVMQKVDVRKPQIAIIAMQATTVNAERAVLAVAYRCLQQNQLKDAVDIMNEFKLLGLPELYQPLLISALKETNDIASYVKFLCVQYQHFKSPPNENNVVQPVSGDDANILFRKTDYKCRADILGSIIYNTLITLNPRQCAETFRLILQGLVQQGVAISLAQASRIEVEIQPWITPDISVCLTQLTSHKLKFKHIERPNFQIPATSYRIEKRMANSVNVDPVELFEAYHREGQITKMNEMIQNLEKSNCSISPKMYVIWIQSKLKAKKLSEAVDICNRYKKEYNNSLLPSEIVAQVVSMYIENDEIDKALRFLESTKPNDAIEVLTSTSDSYFHLLTRLAEKEKVVEIELLVESLINNKHLRASSKLFSSLIQVHLKQGNIPMAVATFERIVKRYKLTPYKRELSAHLIKAEDWVTLEQVVAACSTVHGKGNSLIDLALIYIECNEITKAQQIFNQPDLCVPNAKVVKNCSIYERLGSIQHLQSLYYASINSSNIKREPIFSSLLNLYITADQPKRALDLWVKFQEHSEIPSDAFLYKLGTFLTVHDIDVPFDITDQTKISSDLTPMEKQFVDVLLTGNLGTIRDAYLNLPAPNLTAVIRKNSSGTKALKYLYDALADGGFLIGLEQVNSMLPKERQNSAWYIRSQCKACTITKMGKDWLHEWDKKLDRCETVTDLEILDYSFPDSEFYNLLESEPNLLEQCDAMARKYATKDVMAPMGAIWCYHFIRGNKEIAENIWKNYIQDRKNILYRPIIKRANETNDDKMLRELLGYLQSSAEGRNNLEGAYSALLDILVRKKEYDEALTIAEILEAKSALVKHSTIGALKIGLSLDGKQLPFRYETTKFHKKVTLCRY